MSELLLEAIGTTMKTLPIVILTAAITAWITLRRFRSERWWERKADTYTCLVEHLHNAREFCSREIDEMLLSGSVREEERARLASECHRGINELRKLGGIGAFIISSDVTKILVELEKDISAAPYDPKEGDWMPGYEHCMAAYDSALESVRMLALKELGIPRRLW